MTPTDETYGELQQAFNFYNKELFDGELPSVLITLQREKRTMGYYSSKRFARKDGQTTDEIAMNPSYFAVTPVEDVLSTLAHEMCHHWQMHKGTPSRRGYHNAEWAQMMIKIGLQPTETGLPGGRITGDRVDHYIVPEGRFIVATRELLANNAFSISWFDRFPAISPEDTESKLNAIAAAGVKPPVTGIPAKTILAAQATVKPVPAVPDEGKPVTEADAEHESDDQGEAPFEPDNPSPQTETTAATTSAKATSPAATVEQTPLIKLPEPAVVWSKEGKTVLPKTDLSNRVKYVCPGCYIKVWGKPKLQMLCVPCGETLAEGLVVPKKEKDKGKAKESASTTADEDEHE